MAIALSDVTAMLSNPAASAGNALAQADANASLGGFLSTTAFSAAKHGLVSKFTGRQTIAGTIKYRCLFIKNNHPTLPIEIPHLFIASQVAGGATVQVGVDPTAQSVFASGSAQAVTVANENTAPAGVVFNAVPVDYTSGLLLGQVDAGKCKAFWLQVTALNTGPVSDDNAVIEIDFDTAA